VAITFDDGPHAQNTPRLLDLLKERKVRATFFVVGQNAVEYPEILKRIAGEGHELANHSYSHPILASLGESALREQMEKTSQAVLKATGVTMRLMRPPYGALSEPQRRFVNATYNYRVILWDVDPLDWKHRDAGRVQSEITGRAKPGSIILAHDIHKSTVDAMPATLDALLAKGFKFVTVSELLAMDKPGASKPARTGASEAETVEKTVSKSNAKDKKAASGSGDREGKPAAKRSAKPAESEESKRGSNASSKKPETPEETKQRWLKMFGR
jgi:peptidoglycan/xylan/chitin deacetylase (PgdA/CDA1 family)